MQLHPCSLLCQFCCYRLTSLKNAQSGLPSHCIKTIRRKLSECICTIIEIAEAEYACKAHQICKSHLILHKFLLVFAKEWRMGFFCS